MRIDNFEVGDYLIKNSKLYKVVDIKKEYLVAEPQKCYNFPDDDSATLVFMAGDLENVQDLGV